MKTPPSSPSLFSTHSQENQSLKKRNAEDPEIELKRQKLMPKPKLLPKGARKKSTPLATRNVSAISHPMPATPGWNLKRKNIDTANFFQGNRLVIETDPHPIDMGIAIATNNIYRDRGAIRNVFKQPEGSKSCWAYSFAMLVSDLFRENRNEMPLEKLQEWMDNSYLLRADKVKTFASSIGIELEHTKIPLRNPLEHLQDQLEKSGHSLLISIDHPEIMGHAIVVDHISDTETTLRDPFTGKAWRISNEEMVALVTDDDVSENCLSLSTKSN